MRGIRCGWLKPCALFLGLEVPPRARYAAGMMGSRDPYEVLGVSRDATADEIRVAYREAAKKYHPDVVGNRDGNDVDHEFAVITVAYETVLRCRREAAARRAMHRGSSLVDLAHDDLGWSRRPHVNRFSFRRLARYLKRGVLSLLAGAIILTAVLTLLLGACGALGDTIDFLRGVPTGDQAPLGWIIAALGGSFWSMVVIVCLFLNKRRP